jgi:aspartate dehydrogenase
MTKIKKQDQLKVGIAGCGAIGSTLASRICSGLDRRIVLSALYDQDEGKAAALSKKVRRPYLAVRALGELIRRSDIVVEATALAAAYGIALESLTAGRSVLVMSVGGILQQFGRLQKAAAKAKAHIYIPSGAVSGIDAVKAASAGKIGKVTLTTIKPVSALQGSPYFLKKQELFDNIASEKEVFCGDVISAVRNFPQNINVAATVALAAGLPAHKIRVRIIASRKVSRNIHELEIESDSGLIRTRTENVIHELNPKTSYLAVLSAVATLRQIVAEARVGT